MESARSIVCVCLKSSACAHLGTVSVVPRSCLSFSWYSLSSMETVLDAISTRKETFVIVN
jgi:hypothetical protein